MVTQEAHFNWIEGNTEFGASTDPNGAINAEYNYWGSPSGPGGVGLDTGSDDVSASVDFNPWLCAWNAGHTCVSGTSGPNQTTTTEGSAGQPTATDTQTTSVFSPNGGSVSITESSSHSFASSPPPAHFYFGQEVNITAPAGTVVAPLVLTFEFDVSILPAGFDLNAAVVRKGGVVVLNCTGAPTSAIPDPCVKSRGIIGGGDFQIVVNTTTASIWDFLTPTPTCTITGTPGPDFLMGTANPDVICGRAGNDIIIGKGGNDQMFGEGDNDTIYGKDGNDDMFGGDGNDDFFGGLGNDEIYGGIGNDRMWGGPGVSLLSGGNDNDLLVAHGSNDTLDGGDGNNDMLAGDGGDTITAGNGNNYIQAGSGINTITTGSGNDQIFTGDGNNTINAGDGVNVIFAGDQDNVITTGTGADFILAGTGADTISSGDGNDVVFASAGVNTINGGGNDDYLVGGEQNDSFDGGPNSDTCDAGPSGTDTQVNCENLVGTFP